MLEERITNKIFKNTIHLEKYGLNDLAWTKKNAVILIHEIIDDRIGILGGDVYKLHQSQLEIIGDNWSCEPNGFESEPEYYLRSKLESLKYIENYSIQSGEDILFSITFTEQLI